MDERTQIVHKQKQRKGGAMPPPWSSEGGATFQLYNDPNSLQTRLKQIKITLKVDFIKKVMPWPLQHFFQRGVRVSQKVFCALCAQIHQNSDFSNASGPPGKILYPSLVLILNGILPPRQPRRSGICPSVHCSCTAYTRSSYVL